MKIKDKKTKQIFNVFSSSVAKQMLGNKERYVEIGKETENSSPNQPTEENIEKQE